MLQRHAENVANEAKYGSCNAFTLNYQRRKNPILHSKDNFATEKT